MPPDIGAWVERAAGAQARDQRADGVPMAARRPQLLDALNRLYDARRSGEDRIVMRAGFVSLVGAGPGHPDYLTLKALRRLREADLVFHDALVSAEVCALATRAMRINVGKRAGREQTPQAEIERLLIEAAQQACAWCASRAAIRLCSAAAAKRRWRCSAPASRSKWCPASPPRLRRRRWPAFP